MAGVLFGLILSNIYRDIDLMFFIPRNLTKLPVRKTLYRIVRIFMCISVIWLPFFFIDLNPTGYLSWFTSASGVGLYAVIIVVLSGLIFDRNDMKSLARRIMRMVRT